MNARTQALQFDQETRRKIIERDEWCIFCQIGYRMPDEPQRAMDIMHIVPRSQGGLGIEENGVVGCRWHHMMLDNGNKGERPAMMAYIENYMKRHYPDWDREKLIYKKGETT